MKAAGQIVRQAGQEHRQELAKLIRQAARSHALWQIWDDLMFFGAAALSQPLGWAQEREDEYLRRIARYPKDIQALFPRMFAEIVLAFEQEGCKDILGAMYMQLELYNKWRGQFFTPDSVCELMVKMNATDIPATVEKKGFATVSDPACGGGAMLIATAKVVQEAGVNYQTSVLFEGRDIDPVVARMCYISMSLLGMPGRVVIGNTLLMTQDEILYTPMYFVRGFHRRQQIRALFEDADTAETPLQEAISSEHTPTPRQEEDPLQPPDEPATTPLYRETQSGQFTLF